MNTQVFDSNQGTAAPKRESFDLIHVNRMSYATAIGPRSRFCKGGFFLKVDASSPNCRIGPIVSARKAGIKETGIEIDPFRSPCPLQSPVKPLRYEEAAESA